MNSDDAYLNQLSSLPPTNNASPGATFVAAAERRLRQLL
jgi:hypothetical protein